MAPAYLDLSWVPHTLVLVWVLPMCGLWCTWFHDPCSSPCRARVGKNRGPGHETLHPHHLASRPTARAWT